MGWLATYILRAAAAARLTAVICSSLGPFDRTGLLGGIKAAAGGSRRCLLAALASSLDAASAGLVAGLGPAVRGRRRTL